MTPAAHLAWPMLLALMELAPGMLLAQEAKPSPSAQQATPELVRSKETMVRRLLTDSPVAQRIVLSTSAEAKTLFGRAQEQYSAAASALKAGDLARADAAFNDALWTVGKARQLVPDEANQRAEQNVRYGRLLETTATLGASYGRHLARNKAAGAEPELAKIEALVAEGKALANTEQLSEAIRALEKAEQMLMAGINRTLGSATLEYSEKFDSPADEFAFELERNKSFADLVPLAVGELRPSEDAKRLVERYVEQNRALREQAQAQAKATDYGAALKSLRSGTSSLQRALLAAGLVVPQQEAKQE